MTQRNLPRRTSQRGFALAAVLWLLAGLSIVVALVSEAALTAKQRIAQLRERTDFIQDAISARAELEYRLSASRPTTNGLTDGITLIKTDGSPYQVRAKSLVQLQDLGGLISLNVVSRPLLSAHLQKCGVPAESTETLLDALEDYTDADNLTRINGAERETYALNGKKGPRNSPLLSVPELWSVWGWTAYRSTLENNDCVASLTTYGEASFAGSRVNPATAPASVLVASGLGAEAVESILAGRSNPDDANANPHTVNLGGLFGQAIYSLKSLRVRHFHPTGPWVMEYTMTLDSGNPDRPWTLSQLTIGAFRAKQAAVIQPQPWPQEPPSVTTSDAAKLLNL